MLKGNFRIKRFIHKYLFKTLIVFGLSIMAYASISLYNQTYSLDVIEFSNNDTILFNVERLTISNGSDLDLFKRSANFGNTIIITFDEIENSIKRKASLLSVVYTKIPKLNENFGTMTIKRLDRKLPIIQGTSDKQLNQGVGHVTSSVLPGENDNLVLAGHRETSFRDLDELQIGDQILIQTELGDFMYEVDHTQIVDDDDETVIVSKGYASLTLVTCYPFDWIGSAPQRYIVNATLVQSNINE